MDNTTSTTISLINLISQIVSTIFNALGGVAAIKMLTLMQRQLTETTVPKTSTPQIRLTGSAFTYLSKSVWVFFALPIISITYVLLWIPQPTVTLVIANLVVRTASVDHRIDTIREEYDKAINSINAALQMSETQFNKLRQYFDELNKPRPLGGHNIGPPRL